MTADRRLLGWRVLLAAALVLAVTLALVPHPPTVRDLSDKSQHMAAFATLALLATQAFPRAPLLRVAERLSFLGAMIEVVQSIPALHRSCDIMDWVADTVAIAAALLLVAAVRRRRAAT